MSLSAPHLPDAHHAARVRLSHTLLVVVILSLCAGFAGGVYAMRAFLPRILDGVFSSLGLSAVSRENAKDSAGERIPFAHMAQVTAEFVKSGGDEVRGHGIGFTSDGWVITHRVVLEKGKNVVRDFAQNAHTLKKTFIDSATDLAFIKVDTAGWQVPRVSESVSLEVGEKVYVVLPYDGIYTTRITSLYGIFTEQEGIAQSERYERMITLDSVLPENAMGAGVFNAQGILVGIVSSHATRTGHATAIPLRYALQTFRDAVLTGKIAHPYFGVRFEIRDGARVDITNESGGVLLSFSGKIGVSAVRSGSPAQRAGIREGDRIVAIENEEVGRAKSLSEIILAYHPGQTVQVTIERNGSRLFIPVLLGTFK